MKQLVVLIAGIVYLFPAVAQPTWDWARCSTGPQNPYPLSVANDANGNTYTCIAFSDSITLDQSTYYGWGNSDICIVKYDSAGHVAWVHVAGSSGFDMARGICVAADGSIYAAGTFYDSTIVFGNDTIIGSMRDIFLVKYDAGGNLIWLRNAGGANMDDCFSVTTDANSNVIIVGQFTSPVCYFDAIPLTGVYSNSPEIFVAKYDVNGNVLWARAAGCQNNDYANDVACDVAGNIYVTGRYGNAPMTIGNFILPYAGNWDFFVAKYSSGGNEIWARGFGGQGQDNAVAIGVTSMANVILAGDFGTDTLMMDSIALLPPDGKLFIASLDSSGNTSWAINEGSANYYTFITDLDIDNQDNVYVTGIFGDSYADFSGDTIYNAVTISTYDYFVVKYNVGGSVQWIAHGGGALNDEAMAVTVKANDDFAVVGMFFSSVLTFPPDTLLNTGTSQFFIARAGSGISGMQSAWLQQSAVIFPNPSSHHVTVKLEEQQPLDNMTLCVYNNFGQIVIAQVVSEHELKLDCSKWGRGEYLIYVSNGKDYSRVSKLIVE